MKKSVILFLLLFCFEMYAEIKDSSKTNFSGNVIINSVNLDLLGQASLLSANFENMIGLTTNVIFSWKLGLGYNEEFDICFSGDCGPPKSYVTLPHSISFNFGGKGHYLETNIGGTILLGETKQPYIPNVLVGYRLIDLNRNKMTFRVFFQYPIRGYNHPDILFFPVGLSVGFNF